MVLIRHSDTTPHKRNGATRAEHAQTCGTAVVAAVQRRKLVGRRLALVPSAPHDAIAGCQ